MLNKRELIPDIDLYFVYVSLELMNLKKHSFNEEQLEL